MTKKILSAVTIILFSISTYAVEVDANHIAKSKSGMVVTNGDHSTAIGVEIPKWSGKVNVIYKAGDEFTSVTDPREPGKALGY